MRCLSRRSALNRYNETLSIMPEMASISVPPGREFLERILRRRQERVAAAAARRSQAELERAAARVSRRGFASSLRGHAGASAPAIIAELKQASPSRGRLRDHYQPAAIARGYAEAGAAALSVLTEEDFFLGSLEDLQQARAVVPIPVLRKDFIFSEYQIWEAAAAGADAVLLIVALLDNDQLNRLAAVARRAELEALIEVHDARELQLAAQAGAELIGVNNRDLRSFEVNPGLCLELASSIPPAAVAVAESGIDSRDRLQKLRAAGFTAALIGEHFMRAPDPGQALRSLRRGLDPAMAG